MLTRTTKYNQDLIKQGIGQKNQQDIFHIDQRKLIKYKLYPGSNKVILLG